MSAAKDLKVPENLRSQIASSSLSNTPIASKIVVFRDVQVMIDRDLAELYGVETKRLKEQVNRNIERFPEQFMFQLSLDEYQNVKKSLWSQIATIENNEDLRGRHTKYLPYAFTEQGVAMLSAVLRSEKAVRVSIEIMNAFVQMRHYLHSNLNLAGRLTAVENKVDSKFKTIDENFSKIFNALDSNPKKAKEGVFFKGQVFDAYVFFQDLIKTAKKEIVLIDGYVDLSVLERLSAKQKNVAVKIFTHPKAELQQIDVDQFNKQYPTLVVDYTQKMHDRFMIIDNKELYHIGASLKDLGKACFAFEKMEDSKTLIPDILAHL
jgi:hypothetical protein